MVSVNDAAIFLRNEQNQTGDSPLFKKKSIEYKKKLSRGCHELYRCLKEKSHRLRNTPPRIMNDIYVPGLKTVFEMKFCLIIYMWEKSIFYEMQPINALILIHNLQLK